MSPRLAARTAMVCTLVALATPAVAQERRQVAVIDLTLGVDPSAAMLAAELKNELIVHSELQRLDSVEAENALITKPPDDDAERLASAKDSLAQANRYLAAFDSERAEANADSGMGALLNVTPRVARSLYAELSLARGLAMLGQHNPAEARAAFALVHALTPGQVLDPARYLPEIVTAFEEAKPGSAMGTLHVTGGGEIWIDGESRGAAPRTFKVPTGNHLVQLTGVDRETRGIAIKSLMLDSELNVPVPEAKAPEELQIRRARLALAQASDTFERASTMGRLAKLIKAGDAILLSTQDGKLMVQTWRDRAPGFSKLEDRGTRSPADLLMPLAPPPPKKPKPLPAITLPPEVPRWYQKRSVQVSVAVGVLGAVIGAVIWARRGVEMHIPNRNLGTPGMGERR